MRKPKLMLIGNSSDLITLCKLEYVSFLNRSSLNAIGILGPCIEEEIKREASGHNDERERNSIILQFYN